MWGFSALNRLSKSLHVISVLHPIAFDDDIDMDIEKNRNTMTGSKSVLWEPLHRYQNVSLSEVKLVSTGTYSKQALWMMQIDVLVIALKWNICLTVI